MLLLIPVSPRILSSIHRTSRRVRHKDRLQLAGAAAGGSEVSAESKSSDGDVPVQ